MYVKRTEISPLRHPSCSSPEPHVHPPLWSSKRFLVAITMLIGFSNNAAIMINIDIALIEMTSNRTITQDDFTITKPPEFTWNRAIMGVISSAHSYAGLFPFVGSYLSSELGGSTSCVLCLIFGGVITLLHPIILYINFYLFLAARFLVGVSTTSYFVSSADIFSRWYPKKEKSTLISLSYSGLNIAAIAAYPIYGYIATCWGWKIVFYVSGTISLLVSLLLLTIVKSSPTEDKFISKDELVYIIEGTDTTLQKKVNHPYKKILTSVPILALCTAKFSFAWVQSLMYESVPLYIKDITQKTTSQVGLIASIPIIAPPIVYPLSGILLDYWKNHSKLPLTLMHKLMLSTAYLTTSVLFLVAASISNFTVTMGIFTLIQIVQWSSSPAIDFLSVHLAPNDASVVTGLIVMTLSLGFIISRTVAGILTINHTLIEWKNCFFGADIILILGIAVFLKYGSSETQPWSLPVDDEERRHLMENEGRPT